MIVSTLHASTQILNGSELPSKVKQGEAFREEDPIRVGSGSRIRPFAHQQSVLYLEMYL